jgi:hypothetical protein
MGCWILEKVDKHYVRGKQAGAVILSALQSGWLVTHIGHFANQESGLCSPANGLAMAEHIIHCYRQGCDLTKHSHAQAVSDQNHFDPGLFLEMSSGEVITR